VSATANRPNEEKDKTMTRKFMSDPIVDTVLTGEKVTGPIKVRYIGSGEVSVTVDAHINDKKPAVVFRGEDYLVHVFIVRHADGIFGTRKESHNLTTVTRRSNWSPAPRTFADAIVRAIIDHVRDIWNVDLDRQATMADANNELIDAEKKRATLSGELRALDEEIARLNIILEGEK
jgi:hypothetical protein